MECAIAIQYLPLDAGDDKRTCQIVDQVIAAIDASGLDYYVGPFETTVEGDFESCMRVLKDCMEAGAAAGCTEMASYVKISWRPGGRVMSTDEKIGKYHPTDTEFATRGIA